MLKQATCALGSGIYNAAMKVNSADTIIEVGGIRIGPGLTKQQAEELYGLGEEAVVFVLTTQAKMIARQIADSFIRQACLQERKQVKEETPQKDRC